LFNLGFSEITLIAVMALLLFGPDRMPEFFRTVGRMFKEFRRMSAELQSTVHETVSSLDSDAARPPSLKEVYDRVDPRRALEGLGALRTFADPAPGEVVAPPASDPGDGDFPDLAASSETLVSTSPQSSATPPAPLPAAGENGTPAGQVESHAPAESAERSLEAAETALAEEQTSDAVKPTADSV